MQPRRMLWTVGLALAVSLASATAAQADTVIIGTVSDATTKKPVADVVVTATSPALQGEQVVVTGEQGQYRIPQLPPGLYTLRFEKESFKLFYRSELKLRLDRTLRVNVELLPRSFPDGTPDDIPVFPGNTPLDPCPAIGMHVNLDFFPRAGLNRPPDKRGGLRSFESRAELVVPGAHGDAYGVSIHGASPFENTYRVDGLSTTDPLLGLNALPLSVEFLEDINFPIAGYVAEYGGATEGLFQARTRSGDCELHGSVFGHWAPWWLGGTPTPASGPTWTISGQNRLDQQGALGATLGGSLLGDQLWFFAGVAPAFTRVEHTRTLNARGPGPDGTGVLTPIPGTSRSFSADERSLQALGKLTWLINGDHNMSLSIITTPSRSGGEGPLTVDPRTGTVRELINGQPDSLPRRELDGNYTKAAFQYAGAFLDKYLLVDAHLAWSRQMLSSSSQPRIARATFSGPVTDLEPSPEVERACGTDPAEQLASCPVLDYELGGDTSLSLDMVDRYQANAQATWLTNALGQHVVKAGVGAEHLDYERTRGFDSSWDGQAQHLEQTTWYTREALGGFLQDSWTLAHRFTVNAGVRYDLQWLYTPRGDLAFTPSGQLSPRVGLSLDPLANGRLRLFAHYAKYRGQLPLELMARVGEVVDPGLVLPSSSELAASAEFEALANLRLSAAYTRHKLDSVVEDLSRDGGSFFLGNPGAGLARDFPKAERTYDAVTVALTRVFAEGWLAQASYTWSRLYGNYAGPFRPTAGWGEPALQSDFDLPSQLPNRLGLLPNDRTHSLKFFGARQFVLSDNLWLDLGLSYRGRSGTPINHLGAHPSYGMGEVFVLPRGSTGERTPWVHTLDPSLDVKYRLGGGKVVSLSLEAFNVFNFQAVTRVNEHYTYASVLPLEARVAPGALTPDMVQRTNGERLTGSDINREFKKPSQYQAPRQVRIGLRYAF